MFVIALIYLLRSLYFILLKICELICENHLTISQKLPIFVCRFYESKILDSDSYAHQMLFLILRKHKEITRFENLEIM